MKPTIKKVQPVKVVAPFLNSQSESPVPLDALTDQEKVSDLYFLKGTVHQIAKPYLSINNCTFKQQIFSECQFKSAQLCSVHAPILIRDGQNPKSNGKFASGQGS